MKLPSESLLIAGGVAVAALALFWLTRPGNAAKLGSAVGGAAVNLVTGTVSGAGGAVYDAANSNSNPLQPFGTWLGGKIYDLTHATVKP